MAHITAGRIDVGEFAPGAVYVPGERVAAGKENETIGSSCKMVRGCEIENEGNLCGITGNEVMIGNVLAVD
jgi:hypothetical protein